MDIKVKTWLYDILQAIREIDLFFIERPKQFADYERDLLLKRAVERNIEIIGEAMSRILKLDETIQISNPRKIVDARNKIIHGYDAVSDDIIWAIVIKYLPILKNEIESLLQDHWQ